MNTPTHERPDNISQICSDQASQHFRRLGAELVLLDVNPGDCESLTVGRARLVERVVGELDDLVEALISEGHITPLQAEALRVTRQCMLQELLTLLIRSRADEQDEEWSEIAQERLHNFMVDFETNWNRFLIAELSSL